MLKMLPILPHPARQKPRHLLLKEKAWGTTVPRWPWLLGFRFTFLPGVNPFDIGLPAFLGFGGGTPPPVLVIYRFINTQNRPLYYFQQETCYSSLFKGKNLLRCRICSCAVLHPIFHMQSGAFPDFLQPLAIAVAGICNQLHVI